MPGSNHPEIPNERLARHEIYWLGHSINNKILKANNVGIELFASYVFLL